MIIRKIKKKDLIEIEELIKNTILEVNSKNYSKWVIDFMLSVDPFRPRDTRHERDYFILIDKKIQGVIGLKDNEIKTFFVDSAYRRKWIWTSLLTYIEKIISNKKITISKVYSSLWAKSFYEKHWYNVIHEDLTKIGEWVMLRYYMEKEL